jgi:hypothetical protein
MKTLFPPHPAIDLSTHLYYALVYTLTDLMPPPLGDTQERLCTRNHAAIARSLLPVEAPAAYVDQRIEDYVSYNGTNPHGVVFET